MYNLHGSQRSTKVDITNRKEFQKPINLAELHQAIWNIIWNWKKTQKCAFKKNSLQALMRFRYNPFHIPSGLISADWKCPLGIHWRTQVATSLHFPHIHTRYPKEWPNAHKHSQTMIAAVGLPTKLLLVITTSFFCTATVGVAWSAHGSKGIYEFVPKKDLPSERQLTEVNIPTMMAFGILSTRWWLHSPAVPYVVIVNNHGTVIYFGKQQESLHMSASFRRWRKTRCSVFSAPSLGNPCWSHLFEPIQASIQRPNLQQTTPLSQPTVASISWSTIPNSWVPSEASVQHSDYSLQYIHAISISATKVSQISPPSNLPVRLSKRAQGPY